jgi:hypothetical protein
LKRSDFAVSLRDIHTTIRLGFVSACYKVFPYGRKKGRSSLGFDVLKTLAIDTPGSSVSLGITLGLFEGFHLRNVHEEFPEAMRLIRLRLSIDPSSQILQMDE